MLERAVRRIAFTYRRGFRFCKEMLPPNQPLADVRRRLGVLSGDAAGGELAKRVQKSSATLSGLLVPGQRHPRLRVLAGPSRAFYSGFLLRQGGRAAADFPLPPCCCWLPMHMLPLTPLHSRSRCMTPAALRSLPCCAAKVHHLPHLLQPLNLLGCERHAAMWLQLSHAGLHACTGSLNAPHSSGSSDTSSEHAPSSWLSCRSAGCRCMGVDNPLQPRRPAAAVCAAAAPAPDC